MYPFSVLIDGCASPGIYCFAPYPKYRRFSPLYSLLGSEEEILDGLLSGLFASEPVVPLAMVPFLGLRSVEMAETQKGVLQVFRDLCFSSSSSAISCRQRDWIYPGYRLAISFPSFSFNFLAFFPMFLFRLVFISRTFLRFLPLF